MSTKTSSSLSVFPPVFSSSNSSHSNSSINAFDSICNDSIASKVIFTMYTSMNILLFFPFCIFILSMGFQRWRHQHSVPSGMTMSHSDFFTYNMMIVETFGVFGPVSYTVGSYTKSIIMTYVGVYIFSTLFPVGTFFHVLTCVERYLAVVHPITYMRLRKTHGVRIRNICTVCAWLLCIGWLGIVQLFLPNFPITPLLWYLGVCIVLIIFCCLSVLHVLNCQGLGGVGRNKDRVDPSKRRAFHMIMVITGVLLLGFAGIMISFIIQNFSLTDPKVSCVLMESAFWLTVPSRLVLPLLFLHKAGKCCKKKTISG